MDVISQMCIFLNENVWIAIKSSLKIVPNGPNKNISALVQIMAWRHQATSHYLNQWWYASLNLNELSLKQLDIQIYSYFSNVFQ